MKKVKSPTGLSVRALYSLALLRVSLGLIFLWAFFDKLFGLGFATCRDAKTDAVTTMCEKAWSQGGSPTTGFLKFGTDGPFADTFKNLAGQGWVDWMFMLGLLGVGLALTLGIAMRLAVAAGSAMLLLMWAAVLPPANNPVLDDHIVYILALFAVYYAGGEKKLSVSDSWRKVNFVKKSRLLW